MQERKTERNKRWRKVPFEITQQPKKTRQVWMGRVTYEWMEGPKKGQKTACPITLKEPARLSIRGKDLWVLPTNGEPYIWGEKGHNPPQPDEKRMRDWKRRKSAAKREKRLREKLMEKFQELLKAYGPHEAGKRMATAFVRAHNRLNDKLAKRALAKVYGSVVKTNRVAHLAFARKIRAAVSLTKRAAPKKKKKDVAAALRQVAAYFEERS